MTEQYDPVNTCPVWGLVHPALSNCSGSQAPWLCMAPDAGKKVIHHMNASAAFFSTPGVCLPT